MEARIPPHYLPPKKTLMPWNRISSAPPPQPTSPGLPARLSRFSLPRKPSSPATRSPCPNENDASLPGTPLPYRTSRSPSATPVRPSRLIPWAMPAATAHNTARTQGRKVRRDETGHARRPITTATTLPHLLTCICYFRPVLYVQCAFYRASVPPGTADRLLVFGYRSPTPLSLPPPRRPYHYVLYMSPAAPSRWLFPRFGHRPACLGKRDGQGA